MNFLTTLVAAGTIALSVGAASAATITIAGSANVTDSCALANFTTSVACDGNFTVSGNGNGGNVAGADLNGLFAADGITLTGWSQIDRIGSVSGGTTQQGQSGLFELVTASGSASGRWRLIPNFVFSPSMIYAFALKGGTDQVAYVMDYVTAGTWNNFDLLNNGGQNPGLSNITLFATTNPTYVPPPPPVVPLPAAGWLLVGGLAGLAALRRRTKA